MYRSLFIGLLAIGLVLPAAPASAQSEYDWAYVFAGQSQLLTIDVGPNGVLFKMHDITIEGEMAADARAAIDELQSVGNGDGTVSEEEIVNFEALAQATINSQLPNQFDFDMITIDGKRAFASNDADSVIALTSLTIGGAEGPVTSTDAIQTDIEAMLRFDSVDQSAAKHEVRFENLYGDFTSFDASDAPPAKVIVTGYQSWAIQRDSIQPAEFQDDLADDKIELTNSDFAAFDELGEGLLFTIEGDPEDQVSRVTEKSPGVGPLAFIGVIGIALLGLRRRL